MAATAAMAATGAMAAHRCRQPHAPAPQATRAPWQPQAPAPEPQRALDSHRRHGSHRRRQPQAPAALDTVLVAPTQGPDDWMALLELDAAVAPDERPRSRSPSRSRSIPRGLRPPVESSSEEEGPSDIFIEQSPPKMPDTVQEQCDGLPIFFHHGASCVSDTLRTAVNRYTRGGSFYIGATLNPRMRWVGRSSAGERGDMPGHLLRWDAMIIIAYTAEGPRIETSAIEFAKTLWQDRCTNVKPDARGQVRGLDNFIYVCV